MGVHQQMKGEEQGVKFSDMFDIAAFNAVSQSKGFSEMIAWSDYITNAPRDAVFVEMIDISHEKKLKPVTIQHPIANGSNKCTVRTITAPDNTSVTHCQVREAKVYWQRRNTHTLSHRDIYDTILRGLNPANIIHFLAWAMEYWKGRKCSSSSTQHQH